MSKINANDLNFINAVNDYLKEYQKWRKGDTKPLSNPTIIGIAIDSATRIIDLIKNGIEIDYGYNEQDLLIKDLGSAVTIIDKKKRDHSDISLKWTGDYPNSAKCSYEDE